MLALRAEARKEAMTEKIPGAPSGPVFLDDDQFMAAADSLFSKCVPCEFYRAVSGLQEDFVIVLEDRYFPFTGNHPYSPTDAMNFAWQLAVLGLHPIMAIELSTDMTPPDDKRSMTVVICPTEMKHDKKLEQVYRYLVDSSVKKGKDGKFHASKIKIALFGKHIFSIIKNHDQVTFDQEMKRNPDLMRHFCSGWVDFSTLPLLEIQRTLSYRPEMEPSFQYIKKICPYCKKRAPVE